MTRTSTGDLAAGRPTLNVLPAGGARPRVEVFEPALCCTTGVCGDDVDQALVTFTADMTALNARGATIVRHNLANDPQAFVDTPAVADFLRVVGSVGLPLTLVDGVTVATGSYPDRASLERLAGLAAEHSGQDEAGQVGSSCCGGSGCC